MAEPSAGPGGPVPGYGVQHPSCNCTQNVSKVFCPPATGYKAQLDFTSIDLEYETLYIYDGTDYSATFLAELGGNSPCIMQSCRWTMTTPGWQPLTLQQVFVTI